MATYQSCSFLISSFEAEPSLILATMEVLPLAFLHGLLNEFMGVVGRGGERESHRNKGGNNVFDVLHVT